MTDTAPNSPLWRLAALLAEQGTLRADLTVAAATDGLRELIRQGRLTRDGRTLGAAPPAPPTGWEAHARVIGEAWAWVRDPVAAPAAPAAPGVPVGHPPPVWGARWGDAWEWVRARAHFRRTRMPGPEGPGDDGWIWPGPEAPPAALGPDEPASPARAEPPEPAGAEPPEAGEGEPLDGGAEIPDDGEGAEPERADRRLQAQVFAPGRKAPLTSGFVAGATHQVSVRIAAEATAGAVIADRPFGLVLDRPVTLTVVFRVRGSRTTPASRELTLPAMEGTTWTTPVALRIPRSTAKRTTATVEIVVLHEGRAVQTALLSGPLIAAPAPGHGLRLEVDSPVALAGLPTRSAAQSTLMVSPSATGKPVVWDPRTAGIMADNASLAAAAAVRSILHAAFVAGPTDLASAAAPLTKLAVMGVTLSRKVGGDGDLNAADWIQIVQLGAADLPFELIYTHPMPDSDDEVPVCAPALAGTLGCAADCADRERSDRVCPYAFWGTSKVVERRVHVPGRQGTLVEATVRLADGAVVATSARTDATDATSSQRITHAVTALVGAGRSRRAPDWTALATQVATTPEPSLLVLVTHTEAGTPLQTTLELGNQTRGSHRVTSELINPDEAEPGPIVLSLGCDTELLDAGFATWVQTLQAARASVVVSALSPIPGHAVADFVELLCTALSAELAGPGPHRWGRAMTAARRRAIADGGLLALALTCTGDGDIVLEGEGHVEP